ncbi:MAG: 30S ribosomal protein S8 [Deltaproteobacteria bacterium]|nr:30S ribosomal protein S8 [Deltaproteobacteria bacterium]
MMTDPIGDMLTRIRNAGSVQHEETRCSASKLKLAVAKVMVAEGFIAGVEAGGETTKPELVLALRYGDDGKTLIDGIRRVSTPGRRVYVGSSDVPKVRNGLGIAILSTSKGVLCDRDAREQNVGGEVICEVW